MRLLRHRERRPADLQRRVEPEGNGEPERLQHGRVPLPRRHAAKGEKPQRAVVGLGPDGRWEPPHVDGVADAAHLGALERERAAVDAEQDIRQPRRDSERTVGMPVGVPEPERDPERLDDRGRKDEKGRDHVHEHRIRPLPRAKERLLGKHSLEGDPPPGAGRGTECSDPHVRGQLVAADVVTEHDDLVTPARQRIQDVDRLCERRVVGIHHLGEDDQPHRLSGCRGVPA